MFKPLTTFEDLLQISVLKDRLILAAKSIWKIWDKIFLNDDQKWGYRNKPEFAPEREF